MMARHQRITRRISPDSPVRRCLFPVEGPEDQARTDNYANKLQEIMERDRADKRKKWNFDFENEVPLSGVYEWSKREGEKWVAVLEATDICGDEDLPLQVENEATPNQKTKKELPVNRKRNNEAAPTTDTRAKRKLSYD